MNQSSAHKYLKENAKMEVSQAIYMMIAASVSAILDMKALFASTRNCVTLNVKIMVFQRDSL